MNKRLVLILVLIVFNQCINCQNQFIATNKNEIEVCKKTAESHVNFKRFKFKDFIGIFYCYEPAMGTLLAIKYVVYKLPCSSYLLIPVREKNGEASLWDPEADNLLVRNGDCHWISENISNFPQLDYAEKYNYIFIRSKYKPDGTKYLTDGLDLYRIDTYGGLNIYTENGETKSGNMMNMNLNDGYNRIDLIKRIYNLSE